MKLNTRIKAADGRIGTVCYNDLDGAGGVWGEHDFVMPPGGYGDLPTPQFKLREPYSGGDTNCEYIPEWEIIQPPASEKGE